MTASQALLDQVGATRWLVELLRLGRLAASRDHGEAGFAGMLEHVAVGLGASSGSLAVALDADRDTLQIVAGIDLPDGVVGRQIRLGEGFLGRVAADRRPVLIDEKHPDHDPHSRGGARASSLCWPLVLADRLIGVLSLNRAGESAPFTHQHLEDGAVVLDVLAMVVENWRMHVLQQQRIGELSRKHAEVLESHRLLKEAQTQLLQSEKMASIGQLAAGVAHEINNPIGFVNSNLGSLERYVHDLLRLLDAYGAAHVGGEPVGGEPPALRALLSELDLDFLREDIGNLLVESRDGLDRVRKIVQDLKDFSRADQNDDWQRTCLTDGLTSTLNIVNNELKYKAVVEKELAPLPEIVCLPSQLNQVLMNLMVNAGQAIGSDGRIRVRTGAEADHVWIEVSDNGCGIPQENLNRIFEPFFTTKPDGKGTGLGLSLSYSIVKKHHGRIDVDSTPGIGTTFRVTLPIERPVSS